MWDPFSLLSRAKIQPREGGLSGDNNVRKGGLNNLIHGMERNTQIHLNA